MKLVRKINISLGDAPLAPTEVLQIAEPPKKERKSPDPKLNSLPPDEYKDLVDCSGQYLVLDSERYIKFAVKRGGRYGVPCLDVRLFLDTEVYTGYTKSGINIPLEFLPYLLDALHVIDKQCAAQEVYKDCPTVEDTPDDSVVGIERLENFYVKET